MRTTLLSPLRLSLTEGIDSVLLALQEHLLSLEKYI
jgi:hypothetical protein